MSDGDGTQNIVGEMPICRTTVGILKSVHAP